MLIANGNKLPSSTRKKFRITIGNYTIHEVEQIKYLGVIMDRKLNWNHHGEYLLTKLSRAAGAIYKVRNYLPMKARLLIYNALVGSYLQYGIAAWSCCSETMLNRLQKMQDKILRYITFSPNGTNLDSYYQSFKILKIKQLQFFETAKFMHLFIIIIYLLLFKIISNSSITIKLQGQGLAFAITYPYPEQKWEKSL